MKKILLLPILAVMITVLSLLPQDAHAATNIDLKDQASCEAVPLSGTWIAANLTCRTSSNLTLNSGDTLLVNGTIFDNIVLTTTGTINNNGFILNSRCTSDGTTCEHTTSIINYGTINNYGRILNGDESFGVQSNGNIYNYGTINNKNSGLISDQATDVCCHTINYGTITNSGIIALQYLTNFGTINNSADLSNDIMITNSNSGIINNSGTIDNVLVTIINSGIINNSGTIDNHVGTFTNSGTINNYGRTNSHNAGTIDNSGGTIHNNHGTINNSGTIDNTNGAIYNLCDGGSINNTGTISGNPVKIICPTSTVVTPNPSSVNVKGTITFTGTVTDTGTPKTTPNGTLSWGDGGKFGFFTLISSSSAISSCTLVSSSSSTSTCVVVYHPYPIPGQVTISTSYSGDDAHASSAGLSALSVKLSTTTTISPNPASVTSGASQLYTVTVTDNPNFIETSPTGTVSWKASVSGGSFSSSSCTLSPISSAQSSCQITYTAPTTAGTVTIAGAYGGDSTHGKSSGKATLTVT